MFERFTEKARRIMVVAQEEARLLNHNYLGTEHLLLGFLRTEETVTQTVLLGMGMDYELAAKYVADHVPETGTTTGSPPFTPRAKKVLEFALREALQLGHNWIGPEHMLLALIREGNGLGCQALEAQGVELDALRSTLIQELGKQIRVPQPAGVNIRFTHEERVALLDWLNQFFSLTDSMPRPLRDLYSRLKST